MRHLVRKGRKLNRTLGHRQALLRNLFTSLIAVGRIETTLAKAKELKSFSELLISRSIIPNLKSRRKMFSLITKKEIAQKFFDETVTSFGSRTSGFTRIRKLGRRFSDGSERASIELIERTHENDESG